ncbi:MAG: quinone oxidoreductase [Bryobacteraceae bacterium]|nr:quinone oxidoreductase [Bryobacteraceae bacterium]
MKAVVVHQHGGPEQLHYQEVDAPAPGPGEALVSIKSIGVNFIDIYHRTGLYHVQPPLIPGMEAAGVVAAVGPSVSEVVPGDRVAYAMTRGAYAEYALVPSRNLVVVPEALSFDLAAASMLQGMTAHYLTHSTYPLKQGDIALVHAAAGGAGLLIVQMARMLGARVIGTTSTEAKAVLASQAGCDEVILYTKQDFQSETRRLTGGRGVDVVYDSVGASTFEKSLDSLRPRGVMVTFGNASGPVPPLSPLVLSQKGSLFLTRPTLAHYSSTREELLQRAGDVLGWVAEGKLSVHVHRAYALTEASQAHIDLEARKTTGKLLLKP